jgi:hypothetical protein
MSDVKTENPVPPAIPSVDRVSGKVTMPRAEDNYPNDGYQNWAASEQPNEGGVQETRFNGPDEHSQKQVAEFNKKPASII